MILKSFIQCLSVVGLLASAQAYAAPEITSIGQMRQVRAKYEDTLVHMARANNIGFIEIRAANPHLDPWIPGEGANVIIPTMHILPDAPHQGIVINLAEMRLYYYQDPEQAPISLPIGIGREGLGTPKGKTKIVRKTEGPTWRPTARMREEDPKLPAVVKAGPDNPLGDYALYLGWPQYAIHGTNKPYGIGRRVSSGCIRMYPEGIERLYSRVPVGTVVNVVDQPIKTAWVDDKLYLEAHTSQKDSLTMEKDGKLPDYEVSEKDISNIMEVAGKDAKEINWDAIHETLRKRHGYPVVIAKRDTSILQTKIAPQMSQAGDISLKMSKADDEQYVPKVAVKKTAKKTKTAFYQND
ncbi:MAG: L,D-transpeptidase family protein [Alphaproteobacteria bacterium]|nr:L,D-transpeptidase family protein [Alphaproteobacteria bacterium]